MAGPFIAVHVGAGFHSDANSKELKALCKEACRKAMISLRSGVSSSDATALAIAILENSVHTNAALGSNLSLAGTVECDASLMDGQGNFGAVGAVGGVVNPVLLAHAILKESCQGCLSLGRVPPLVLVGEGANLWAKQHRLATCSQDDLITDRARSVYLDHVARLEGVAQEMLVNDRMEDGLVSHRGVESSRGAESAGHLQLDQSSIRKQLSKGRPVKRKRVSPPPENAQVTIDPVHTCPSPSITRESEVTRPPLDTVGAICLDSRGQVAAGVSSGGISLKSPGRVGQAAMFGCGCWAEDEVKDREAVACSTSGTGEYIIKTSLAKECALAMADCSLHKALDQRFLQSKQLKHVEQKLAGAIALHLDSAGVVHFSWGHTTESMCIGYMVDSYKDPVAIISKMDKPHRSGTSSHIQAIRFHSQP